MRSGRMINTDSGEKLNGRSRLAFSQRGLKCSVHINRREQTRACVRPNFYHFNNRCISIISFLFASMFKDS